ncbi:hypothetical protein [Azospirillum sp. ST 5-10]|uniref:hypothetical protein n=1 Tax=unclassified Azospirillum TaxID=2630922 RepID=UPI003F4A2A93
MSVAPIGTSGPQPAPLAAATAGMRQAQATVLAATEQVAAGGADPAVVVDIAQAETAFAVNAAVLRTGTAMTRRLLDLLA